MPSGILAGKLMKVLNVTTLSIPEARLRLLEQVFSHINQFKVLDYLEYSSCTFSLVLTTLVAYFGLRLGSRIDAPRELKAPLGDLDI